MNTLYYGDNLKILRGRNYFSDACVDLVYLDPSFICVGNFMGFKVTLTERMERNIKSKDWGIVWA